jgi:hypothetical protein
MMGYCATDRCTMPRSKRSSGSGGSAGGTRTAPVSHTGRGARWPMIGRADHDDDECGAVRRPAAGDRLERRFRVAPSARYRHRRRSDREPDADVLYNPRVLPVPRPPQTLRLPLGQPLPLGLVVTPRAPFPFSAAWAVPWATTFFRFLSVFLTVPVRVPTRRSLMIAGAYPGRL